MSQEPRRLASLLQHVCVTAVCDITRGSHGPVSTHHYMRHVLCSITEPTVIHAEYGRGYHSELFLSISL